jgi:hypothetical protein
VLLASWRLGHTYAESEKHKDLTKAVATAAAAVGTPVMPLP